MKRIIAALFLIIAAVRADAQTIQQTGTITSGHAPVFVFNNILGDAGPATNGLLTNLGITANGGLPFCINSHPITQNYSELCLSTSDTLSFMSLQGYGETTPQFEFLINGLPYAFPPLGGGLTTLASVAALRTGNYTASQYVSITGWNAGTYIGGGAFAQGAAGCTDNIGTIFKDLVGNCFYRTGLQTPADISWFGAKSDGLTTVADGTLTIGSTQFCSTVVTFGSGDVGKIIEWNLGGHGLPWRTTIASVDGGTGHCIEAAFASPITFPGTFKADAATISLPLSPGSPPTDAPGTSWTPGECATAVGGTGTPAQVCATGTGMVSYTMTAAGTGYTAGDILTVNDNSAIDTNTIQKAAPQIQVLTIGGGGAIATSALIFNGIYKGTANPTTAGLTVSGGTGTGVTISVVNDSSFGITTVGFNGSTKGNYSVAPANPVSITANTGVGTGATVNLFFSTPDWTYCTDDTVAIRATETYLESIPDSRGLSRRLTFPDGTLTCGQNFTINRPVMWTSSGPKQARLTQILGNAGVSVNGNPGSFIVPAVAYPSGDDYQQTLNIQPKVGFANMAIISMSNSTSGYVDGSGVLTFASNGLFAATPTANSGRVVPMYLQNMNFNGFPGDNLGGQNWDGKIEALSVESSNASGSCLNLNKVYQPTKMYSLEFFGCTNGMNIVSSVDTEFIGVELFKNTIGIKLSGYSSQGRTLAIYGLHCTDSVNQCLDDNATNLSVQLSFPRFKKNNTSNATSGPSDADIVLESLAGSKNNQINAPALVVSAGQFDSQNTDYTVLFNPDASGNYCVPGCYADVRGNYMGKKGEADFPLSVFPATDQQYVHDSDTVGPILTNGQAISFGLDMTSASPCLLPPNNFNAINVVGCDNASDWATFGVGQLNLKNGSNNIQLTVPTLAATYQMKLPATAGLNNQLLASVGGGSTAMKWADLSRVISNISNASGQTFTVGGNWTIGVSYALWDIERSGPTAGFTDTFDTAANIIAGISGAAVNDVYHAVICNNTGFLETLAAGAGDTLAGTTTVAANTCVRFGIRITNLAAAVTITGA